MKRATRRSIESRARRLLDDAGASEIPINLDRIAHYLNVPIQREPLKGDISGLLYRNGANALIVVNKKQSTTRQRFTIAHEIGHFILDHKQDEVHVDKAFALKFRRDSTPAGSDPEEILANAFAAALLMPESALSADMLAHERSGVIYDTTILALAEKYGVSVQALLIRLNTIDLGLTVGIT